jgi:hypothetical protein
VFADKRTCHGDPAVNLKPTLGVRSDLLFTPRLRPFILQSRRPTVAGAEREGVSDCDPSGVNGSWWPAQTRGDVNVKRVEQAGLVAFVGLTVWDQLGVIRGMTARL